MEECGGISRSNQGFALLGRDSGTAIRDAIPSSQTGWSADRRAVVPDLAGAER
jgi:hypothetical protein